MSDKKVAVLVLADGTKFKGFSCGADVSCRGEVVFNTAMVGYPELLSDPASRGQIVVMTYPLIGNYGVPPFSVADGLLENFESGEMQIAGLVVTDMSEEFSHWNASTSLTDWLRQSGVPAICGVDTRALAKHLRDNGEMAGRIEVQGAAESELRVTSYELRGEFGKGDKTVCVLGEGVTNNIVRSLLRRGVRVVTDAAGAWDGMVVTSGARDPRLATGVIEAVREAMAAGKPVLGVCGGDLLLALAAGGEVTRMGHGHRGHNQPVIEVGTPHARITAQNHGWAVVKETLPDDWAVWFENLNDGTVEGIRHKSGPFCGVQFYPEATNRPEEGDGLYDNFVKSIYKSE